MIGVFDSGAGGINALREIRRLMPRTDAVYLADRKNAPYGTKKKGELISLVTRDITRLCEMGIDKILIACCTASTVFDMLPDKCRAVSTPIIGFAARAAAEATRRGKIGVIATDATVCSGAFSGAISSLSPDLSVTEVSAQPLVGLVESGALDGRVGEGERETLSHILEKIKLERIDVLILGCTHFSSLAGEISRAMGDGVTVIDAARVGAREFIKNIRDGGCGKITYTS